MGLKKCKTLVNDIKALLYIIWGSILGIVFALSEDRR